MKVCCGRHAMYKGASSELIIDKLTSCTVAEM